MMFQNLLGDISKNSLYYLFNNYVQLEHISMILLISCPGGLYTILVFDVKDHTWNY